MQIGACYLRVSTEEQTEYSPEAQLNVIKEYARKNDILLPDEFIYRDEGISGRRAEKRLAFQSMVTVAKKKPTPFEVILVHKFDRFARNREDSIVYKSLLRKECGVKVISVTEPLDDDKMSVIIEAMLEAMAEYYSLNLADEVKKGMFEKARRGENIGKAPYGYNIVNSKLVPDEHEAEIIKLIFLLYETESVTKIVQHLNSRGIRTKANGRWTQTTVIYILGNPVYYGVVRYNYRKHGLRNMQNDKADWILALSNHEPLIDKEIFDRAGEKLQLSRNLYVRNFSEKSIKSWTQHLTRCSACGSILTISSCNNQRYKMIRCSRVSLGTCKITNTLSINKLESMVLAQIKLDFQNIESVTIEKINPTYDNELIDKLNEHLDKIKFKKNLARKAYLAEVDSLCEYRKCKTELDKEERDVLSEIERIAQKKNNNDVTKIEHGNFVQLLECESLSIEDKNKVAKQFIKEIMFDLLTKEMSIIYYT